VYCKLLFIKNKVAASETTAAADVDDVDDDAKCNSNM